MESSTAVTSDGGPATANAPRWVVLGCGNHRLALPLGRVQEITPPRPFTRLPGCGPEVCGLVGLRGRVITVCDLGVVLGLPPSAAHPDHRLVLVDGGDRVLGLAVEEVVSVSAAEPDAVAAAEVLAAFPGLDEGWAAGTALVAGGHLLLLDPDALVDGLLAA